MLLFIRNGVDKQAISGKDAISFYRFSGPCSLCCPATFLGWALDGLADRGLVGHGVAMCGFAMTVGTGMRAHGG